MRNIFGIILTLLMSGLFLYLGITGYVKKADLMQHSTKTIGYVKENIRHKNRKSTSYRPLIQFKTEDGETRTFESELSSNPPKYSVEQPVEIIYNPADPRNAEINNPWALWFSPTLLTAFGSIALILPIVSLIRRRRGI